jgi:hypothetical protein
MKILTDNKETLVTLSELLIEREALDFDDVDSIMKTGKLPAGREKVVKVSAEIIPAEEVSSEESADESKLV